MPGIGKSPSHTLVHCSSERAAHLHLTTARHVVLATLGCAHAALLFADLTRAAQRQQPGAINALAQALVRAGQPEEALVWYLRSAAAGDALAQVEAGRMRAYGVGCEVDVGQARAHWELAERQARQQHAICWRPWLWESSR